MKVTREFLTAHAIRTTTHECIGHTKAGTPCQTTDFVMAVQTPGGASHRMDYTEHSSEPGAFYRAARPYCGSRRTLAAHSGAFVAAVTCKRC